MHGCLFPAKASIEADVPVRAICLLPSHSVSDRANKKAGGLPALRPKPTKQRQVR